MHNVKTIYSKDVRDRIGPAPEFKETSQMPKEPATFIVYAVAWMALTMPLMLAGAGLPLSAGQSIGILLCAHALLGVAILTHIFAPGRCEVEGRGQDADHH